MVSASVSLRLSWAVMAELDPFGAPAGAPGGPALGNGVAGAGEEDPAAAFLAQQESEIAGIENDEAFAILDGGAPGPQAHGEPPGGPGERAAAFGREDLGALGSVLFRGTRASG